VPAVDGSSPRCASNSALSVRPMSARPSWPRARIAHPATACVCLAGHCGGVVQGRVTLTPLTIAAVSLHRPICCSGGEVVPCTDGSRCGWLLDALLPARRQITLALPSRAATKRSLQASAPARSCG